MLAALATVGCASDAIRRDTGIVAEARAVGFLKREVPAWSRNNGCFSCHNNGDGARALYRATREGYRVPADVLEDTTAWVRRPDRWEHNKGDPGFSDQRLANIQFAASLIAAFEVGRVNDRRALEEAARKVAADQGEDGAWHIEPQNAVGSPATYGTTLATYIALYSLRRANSPETGEAIRKAEAWLGRARPHNVLTAATLLLASAEENTLNLIPRVGESLDLIRRAQALDGGWGPYVDSPPEPFDTAVVLLALAELRHAPGLDAMIQRGRRFLSLSQLGDGSWPATTRPAGGKSYAQQLSTTGWATLALLATREAP